MHVREICIGRMCTPSGRTRSLNGSPLLALLHHCSPRAWSIHPQTRLLRLHCIPKHIHFSPPPPAVSTETMRDLLTRMCLPASLCVLDACLRTARPVSPGWFRRPVCMVSWAGRVHAWMTRDRAPGGLAVGCCCAPRDRVSQLRSQITAELKETLWCVVSVPSANKLQPRESASA